MTYVVSDLMCMYTLLAMEFVNRDLELRLLEDWWTSRQIGLGLIWGRRRVGKTALLQRFAEGRQTVFHTASGRPERDELAALARTSAPVADGFRNLGERPFADWQDALETLAAAAETQPLLLILDEFPELVSVTPGLPNLIRATWERIGPRTRLSILLCGSAVRTMEAIGEERAPLYGRLDLRLSVHPFRPQEAALMLRSLAPADRALVYGILGGIPLYLTWWDQHRSIRDNLRRLACTPGGLLLTEGELTLATEAEVGELGRQVLYAIATGRTKHNEIADVVRSDPSRTLDRLISLRIIERLHPVTEDPARTRRRIYRIVDNFLAFWLGLLDRYRPEIERGLGGSILSVLEASLDNHIGPRWEDMFRDHVRHLAESGTFGPGAVAVGSYWTAAAEPVEIDAVVLAGRDRAAVAVGEAKWARRVDGDRIGRQLERKVESLPRRTDNVRLVVGARERVDGESVMPVTAEDVFAIP